MVLAPGKLHHPLRYCRKYMNLFYFSQTTLAAGGGRHPYLHRRDAEEIAVFVAVLTGYFGFLTFRFYKTRREESEESTMTFRLLACVALLAVLARPATGSSGSAERDLSPFEGGGAAPDPVAMAQEDGAPRSRDGGLAAERSAPPPLRDMRAYDDEPVRSSWPAGRAHT